MSIFSRIAAYLRPGRTHNPIVGLMDELTYAIFDVEAGRPVDTGALRRLEADCLDRFDTAQVLDHLHYWEEGYLASRRLTAVALGLGRAIDAIDRSDAPAAKAAILASFTEPFVDASIDALERHLGDQHPPSGDGS